MFQEEGNNEPYLAEREVLPPRNVNKSEMGKGKDSNWLEFPASCSDLAGAPDLVFLEAHWDRPASLLQVSMRVGVGSQCLMQIRLRAQVHPPRLETSYINVTQMFCFGFFIVFVFCVCVL